MRLGIERRFFVEAKSLIFLVMNGSEELRVVENRKGFSRFVLLGSLCAAWLVSMGEEVLRNTVMRISLNPMGRVEGNNHSERWE